MAPEITPLKIKTRGRMEDSVDTCWHKAVFAFLTIAFATATLKNSGFFYVGFMDEFGIDRGHASRPSSLLSCSIHASGFLVSLLCRKFSHYYLGLLGSVLVWVSMIACSFAPNITVASALFAIHGCGLGAIYICWNVTLITYFRRYRGTANGIMYVGETASGVIFPNLLLYLQETYSFRNTFLIYGAIALHATAFCMFIKISPNLNRQSNPNNNIVLNVFNTDEMPISSSSDTPVPVQQGSGPEEYPSFLYSLNMFKVPMFYVILMLGATVHFSQITFLTTIVDYAGDKGFPLDVGAMLILYASPGDIFGRIILPFATDRKCVRQPTLILGCYFAISLSMFVVPYASNLALLVAVCIFFELFLGCLITSKIVLVADTIEARLFEYCIGFLGLASMPLILASPSIIGFFRDNMGSYDNLYRLLGAVNLFMGSVFCVVSICECVRRHDCPKK